MSRNELHKRTLGDPSLCIPTSFVAMPLTLPSSWYKICHSTVTQRATLFSIVTVCGCFCLFVGCLYLN